jgi:hypothetical protein
VHPRVFHTQLRGCRDDHLPLLVRAASPNGEDRDFLGHPLVDCYLEFVAGRVRPNTLRAVAFDLKSFFTVADIADPTASATTATTDAMVRLWGVVACPSLTRSS